MGVGATHDRALVLEHLLFLVALWWAQPQWGALTQFIYLSVIGCGLHLCYGAYAMAWTAVGYELSDDYHERAKVAAMGGFILAAVGLERIPFE